MFNITTHCNWVYSSIHYGYETCFLFVEAFFIFDCDKTLNYHSTSNTPVDAQVIFISISNTSQVICFICPLPHIPTIMVSLDVIYNLGGVCISIVWPKVVRYRSVIISVPLPKSVPYVMIYWRSHNNISSTLFVS